jgi:hypothetical protein
MPDVSTIGSHVLIDNLPFTIAECRELVVDIEAALRVAEMHAVAADQEAALRRMLLRLEHIEAHTLDSAAIRARDVMGHPVVVRRGARQAWYVESATCFNEAGDGPILEGRIRHGRRWWGREDVPGDAQISAWRVKVGG